MFNLSTETLIVGRRVATLMEELKPTIKECYIEVSSQDDWADMSDTMRVLKIERLVALDILSIVHLLDPKVVSSLRQAVSAEIKKIIAE